MLPEKALLTLWHAIRKSARAVPFDPVNLGICKRWTEEPYTFGPPLGPEMPTEDGRGAVQVFAMGWIGWHPDRGIETGP